MASKALGDIVEEIIDTTAEILWEIGKKTVNIIRATGVLIFKWVSMIASWVLKILFISNPPLVIIFVLIWMMTISLFTAGIAIAISFIIFLSTILTLGEFGVIPIRLRRTANTRVRVDRNVFTDKIDSILAKVLPKPFRTSSRFTNIILGIVVLSTYLFSILNYIYNNLIDGDVNVILRELYNSHYFIIHLIILNTLHFILMIWCIVTSFFGSILIDSSYATPKDLINETLGISFFFGDAARILTSAFFLIACILIGFGMMRAKISRSIAAGDDLSIDVKAYFNRLIPAMIPRQHSWGRNRDKRGFVSVPGIYQNISVYNVNGIRGTYKELVQYLQESEIYDLKFDEHNTAWAAIKRL